MTKVKRRGAISKNEILFALKKYDFDIIDYYSENNKIKVIIYKDYSRAFNIEFNGKIKIEAIIFKNMYDLYCVYTYPKFIELSNVIPKKAYYHIYNDGSFCYAPPKRPLDENWDICDFINALDSLLYNYFSTEYIGTGQLTELEHGILGLKQYEFLHVKKFTK